MNLPLFLVLFGPFWKDFLDHYRRDWSSSGPKRRGAAPEACPSCFCRVSDCSEGRRNEQESAYIPSIGRKQAALIAQASARMDCVSLRATVRAPVTAEPAESLAVASGSGLGLGASSPAKAIDPLAPLPKVMASQAVAFRSPAEPWSLPFAALLYVAGPPLRQALAEPMSSRR